MTVQPLIEFCKQVGGLSFADIATLLEVPKCTVFYWNKGGVPRSIKIQYVHDRLSTIVDAIKTGGNEPLVPPFLDQHKRKKRVQEIKNELFGLPKKGFTR